MKDKITALEQLTSNSVMLVAKLTAEQNFILEHVFKETEILETKFDTEKATLEDLLESVEKDILVCCLALSKVTIVCCPMINVLLMNLQENLASQDIHFNLRVTHFVQFRNRASLLVSSDTEVSVFHDVVLTSYRFDVGEHMRLHHPKSMPLNF